MTVYRRLRNERKIISPRHVDGKWTTNASPNAFINTHGGIILTALVVVVSTAFLILAVLGAFVIWAPAVFVSTAAAFVSGVGGGRFFRRYTRTGALF